MASTFLVGVGVAEAAGLGKIRVLSGLGQPLRAELELNASRDEVSNMTARLAPPDVFRQAGVEYQSILLDLKFTLDKRGDGKQVVKVSSSRPINEPFLDFLVELNWPAGRLIREYTFLLDPPDVGGGSAARPVSTAEAKVIETGDKPAASTAETTAARAAAKPAAPRKTEAAGAASVTTKAGDTLHGIASAHRYNGVSLEQMLIGVYRANSDAFMDGNINRLKKGVVVAIPDQATVEAIPAGEAKAEFIAKSRDWASYRQKLAAAAAATPAREEAAAQSAGGKVTPRVEDKAAPEQAGKDQVRVSRSEIDSKRGKGVSEEDRVAVDKAYREAQERLQALEKNVSDMQRLLEMKNQRLAELEQQLAGKAAPAPAPAPAPAKPAVPETKPAAPAEEKPAPATVKPEESKPAETAKPVEAAKPPAAPEKPKVAAPPPQPPEPTFLETLLADPVPLAGGGGILALLAGYFLYRRRRAGSEAEPALNTTLAGPSTSGLGTYGAGQSVDTSQTPPQSSEFSQAGPGTIDTDDVDPVAEAEVYMAYGRDAQAEEILLEALQKDGQRTAVHVKLLEIYANRKSQKQFETLAEELYAQTGGKGSDWVKAAALGARLDPANPLYRNESTLMAPVAAAAVVAPVIAEVTSEAVAAPLDLPEAGESAAGEAPFDPEATMVVAPPGMEAQAPAEVPVELTFDTASPANEPLPALAVDHTPPAAAMPAVDDDLGLDFDLTPITPATPVAPEPAIEEDAAHVLEFDLTTTATPAAVPESAPVATESRADDAAHTLDFDLGLPAAPAPEALKVSDEPFDILEEASGVAPAVDLEMPVGTLPAADAAAGMDLDFDIPTVTAEATAPASVPEPPVADVGMAAFDIDLAPPMGDMSAPESAEPALAIDLPNTAAPMAAAEEIVAPGESDVPAIPPAVDLSSINLDLSADFAAAEIAAAPVSAEPAELASAAPVSDAAREEVSTKLDLAKAYEEMGDLEGARELLTEVVAEGPPDLVAEAQQILTRIGD